MVHQKSGQCQYHSGVCLLLACSAALTINIQLADGQETTAAQWRQARELIRDTPCPSHQPDSVAVIRVVNCLQALGKEKAIALLRRSLRPLRGRQTSISTHSRISRTTSESY